MTRHSRFRAFGALALAAALLAAFASEARAQVRVDIAFKRKLYVRYEPMLATVTVNNLSGRPLLLQNAGGHPWFGFDITTDEGAIIAPINPDYALAPAAVGPGEKLTRTVNLTPLFPLRDFGSYRIKAKIYVEAFSRFFSSPPLDVEITDGRPIWEEVVGVPGGDGKPELRTITLLSHMMRNSTRLYVRIQDKENGRIYATHQLGPLLSFGKPEVLLDTRNEIHILQNSSPKQFLYTHLGLDGEVLAQAAYLEAGTRPVLGKGNDGSVAVVGGKPFVPGAEQEAETSADKIGDRTVPLPGS